MSDYMHSICRDIDPEDVQKLMTDKKHKARKKIIKKYLVQSYINQFKDMSNKREYLLVKNTYNLCKLVLPLSLLFSLLSYKYFFTGVYEFRRFYLNTSSIPFGFKIVFSLSIGYYIFEKLWMDYTYNEEVYEMAVKNYNKKLNKI